MAACLTQTRTLTLITDYYHLEVGQRLDVRHREDVVVVALDERLALALRAHLWAWAGVLQGATARVCLSREGSRCQASQAGAAKGPSAGPHYQLACRPSAEEEEVETAARCVLLWPLASDGASARARSRRSAPTSQLGGDARRRRRRRRRPRAAAAATATSTKEGARRPYKSRARRVLLCYFPYFFRTDGQTQFAL